MGSRPLTFTAGRPISAAQAVRSAPNVVPFNRRGRPRAKFEPITSACSSKVAMPPSLTVDEEGISGWYGPKSVIVDFAHSHRGGHTTSGDEYWSNESETGLSLADCAAIAYVVMSTAFYPALALLFSS
jgi:hypothetical protein